MPSKSRKNETKAKKGSPGSYQGLPDSRLPADSKTIANKPGGRA